MRNEMRWRAALAISAALAVVCGGAQAQDGAGEWHGVTTGPFGTSPVGVTLKAKAGGGFEGAFVTPRSTVPLDEAAVDKGALSFSTAQGSYAGRWDAARQAWVGQWTPKSLVVVMPASPGAAPPRLPPPLPTTPMELVLTAGKP